jgi:hypothetical protein
VRIEEIMTSKLWNSEIGSVPAVVYLQQSDFQKFTVQEIQRKGFDMSDVIGDARSKRKMLPLVILNFCISFISNSDIRTRSAPFHLELMPNL